jgi:FKBP-type peptidyl-prolyl cis-trans isomerase
MRRIAVMLLVALAAALFVWGCDEKAASKAPPEKPVAAEATAPKAEKPITKEPSKTNWVTKESGLLFTDKTEGTGTEVKKGDTVVVNYRGWLDDGTEFDSSKKPGRTPFSFKVGGGNVIKGWDEGLVGMKIGGVRELNLSPEMGYGSRGAGNVIPPNANLHFEIELLEVK